MAVSIQEEFKLPSDGKLYEPNIEPKIILRSMTTLEEKKRLGNVSNQFRIISDIMDDCIVNKDKKFTCYDLTSGDFQYLLFKLRTVTYGNLYKLNLKCPYCGNAFEENIDLDELKENKYEEGLEESLLVTLPRSKDIIKLKLLTPRALDEIDIKSKEILSKNPGYDGSPSYILSLMALIDTVNGESLLSHKKQAYVEKMLLADANYLQQAASKIKLGVDTHCVASCSSCKQTFPFLLPFTPEFLGPTI